MTREHPAVPVYTENFVKNAVKLQGNQMYSAYYKVYYTLHMISDYKRLHLTISKSVQ